MEFRHQLRNLWRAAAIVFGICFLAQAVAVSATKRALLKEAHYLFVPKDWLRLRAASISSPRPPARLAPPAGGSDLQTLPFQIKRYRVREGDTISDVAFRFGLSLDTVASLNRDSGTGVHLLQIGETLSIPNQDGIHLAVGEDFDERARRHGVAPELVLATNGATRRELQPSTVLFFPGVQHSGWERSLMTGVAFRRPVTGWVSSPFGLRDDPFSGERRFHRGVDIAAQSGTPVRASLDGLVRAVGENESLGRYVIISHFIPGHSTFYAHLENVLVPRGARVSAGRAIGSVGSTGRSTGPHLHFEVWRNGTPIDATLLIPGLR